MKKKDGFTMIELLATIIILGVIMVIAVPAVTKYIGESKDTSYIYTAKSIIEGTRKKVVSKEYGRLSVKTTYYIPSSCIKTNNSSKSPYGDFTSAYVGIIYDGTGYKYYWISTDETGHGIKNMTLFESLDEKDIDINVSGESIEELIETKGIGNRPNIKILNCDNNQWRTIEVDNIRNNLKEDGKESTIVCYPAETLHIVQCTGTNSGCYKAGYTGENNIITYGTIPNGTPKPGDAYDCKVSTDGDFTERFYYLGSDGDQSTLIYYKSMNNETVYAYDNVKENWHGPRKAYLYLPDITDWNNPGLIPPGTRQIVSETGTTYTGKTIEEFTYTGKAARFLTAEEIVNACQNVNAIGNKVVGELDSCNYLLENVPVYETGSTSSYGYWLETPYRNNSTYVWRTAGTDRNISTTNANAAERSVRPVITVLTSDIGS